MRSALWILSVLAFAHGSIALDLPAPDRPAAMIGQDPDRWPPPGVYVPGKDVEPPRLLRELKPQYTVDAMRARIQGAVVLACIVEPDGTVTRVRVKRSLDPIHGLDHSAVTAVKQWRFTPGTKDGTPIPVLVDVEMTFALGPLAVKWPGDFTSVEGMPDSTAWIEDTAETSGLRIGLAYPTQWSAARNPSATELVLIRNEDGLRAVSVSHPRPATIEIEESNSLARLQQFLAAAQPPQSGTGRQPVLELGQVQIQGRLWAWYESDVPATNLPTGALNPATGGAFARAHLWTFATTAGQQFVTTTCIALIPRDESDVETRRRLRLAGAELAAIVKRISIQVP